MATMQSEVDRSLDFDQLLREKRLRTLFQPIVSFQEERPHSFAVEALTRGPKDSSFETARALFDTAKQRDQIYRLETIARERAIEHFDALETQNLFINLVPNIIYDESFTPGETLRYLDNLDVTRDQVVFEITERNQVKDRKAFEEAVRHYREQGFRIAVDDVGAGYANLDKIAQLKPDYIKIDMSLVRDLHRNRPYSQLVETIIDFGDRIGSEIIAEGIEKKEELQTLLSMGMDYGQGFLLARPNEKPQDINPEVRTVHERCSETGSDHRSGPSVTEFLHETRTFDPGTPSKEVYRYFEDNPEAQTIVLTQGNRPVGLLTRRTLHENLSGNMGQSLYWNRSVQKIAEEDPLIVSAEANIKEVSELVTDKDNPTLHQDVIVVDPDSGHYLGNVSIRTLLEQITSLKTQKARRANPLTGLPGNVEIRDQIQSNLNHGRTFALIYVDLDHFKPFNDYYGFDRGDEAIILLKNVLNDALQVYPHGTNFLGHIGGDDFVAITAADHVENFCEYAIDQFDERIRELYDPEDLNEGFIQTETRQGETVEFNVMSVSLAVVTNRERTFKNHLDMSEVAAEMKKFVKKNREESSYAIDRRS